MSDSTFFIEKRRDFDFQGCFLTGYYIIESGYIRSDLLNIHIYVKNVKKVYVS